LSFSNIDVLLSLSPVQPGDRRKLIALRKRSSTAALHVAALYIGHEAHIGATATMLTVAVPVPPCPWPTGSSC
jgi:hypothetical protein